MPIQLSLFLDTSFNTWKSNGSELADHIWPPSNASDKDLAAQSRPKPAASPLLQKDTGSCHLGVQLIYICDRHHKEFPRNTRCGYNSSCLRKGWPSAEPCPASPQAHAAFCWMPVAADAKTKHRLPKPSSWPFIFIIFNSLFFIIFFSFKYSTNEK